LLAVEIECFGLKRCISYLFPYGRPTGKRRICDRGRQFRTGFGLNSQPPRQPILNDPDEVSICLVAAAYSDAIGQGMDPS
jgi:hypothetical protein